MTQTVKMLLKSLCLGVLILFGVNASGTEIKLGLVKSSIDTEGRDEFVCPGEGLYQEGNQSPLLLRSSIYSAYTHSNAILISRYRSSI